MRQRSFDLEAAEHRAEAGKTQVINAASKSWQAVADQAIDVLARRGAIFTADDVRRLAGDPPAGTHYNIMGALLSRAAKSAKIVLAGYGKSARVIGHGNLVRQWRGAGR